MEVGDRVVVKGGNMHYPNKWGSVVARVLPISTTRWEVLLEGNRSPLIFKEDELLPVEVVVLEGNVTFPFGDVPAVGGKLIGLGMDYGDEVRVTVERVKKEG